MVAGGFFEWRGFFGTFFQNVNVMFVVLTNILLDLDLRSYSFCFGPLLIPPSLFCIFALLGLRIRDLFFTFSSLCIETRLCVALVD